MTPTEAIIASAGGDFFLTIFAAIFIFILGLCSYLVYRMPKEWENSTDRLIAKMCDVIREQQELRKVYLDHDIQAKDIKKDVVNIKTTLRNRPCIHGHLDDND